MSSQKEAAAGAESAPEAGARVPAAPAPAEVQGPRLRVKPPVPVRQSSTCLASAAETSLESDRKSDPCYPRSLPTPNTLSCLLGRLCLNNLPLLLCFCLHRILIFLQDLLQN